MSISTSILFQETSGAAFNAVVDVSFSDVDNVMPVTRELAKKWARIDDSYDDTIVDHLIISAISILEAYLNQSILSKTVTSTINNSCGNQYLPYGPVKSIISVTDDVGNTYTDSEYTLTGESFKRIQYPVGDNLKFVYTTGYESLPAQIKTAILCQVAYMYENRGDDTGLKSQISPMAKAHVKSIKM